MCFHTSTNNPFWIVFSSLTNFFFSIFGDITLSIPNKHKYWKVFEDDIQIKIFLVLSYEFVNTQIHIENRNSENFQENVQFAEENVEHKRLKNMIGGKEIIN